MTAIPTLVNTLIISLAQALEGTSHNLLSRPCTNCVHSIRITAIMLGRLRMNIQQSLDVYTNLATRIFAKRRPLWKYHKYDHYQLEQLMAGVVKANCPDHQPLDVPLLTNPRDLAEYGRGHPNLNQLRYTQCRMCVGLVRCLPCQG